MKAVDSKINGSVVFARETYIYLRNKIVHKALFRLSVALFLFAILFSVLHYTGVYFGNHLSWISWLISVISFSSSFLPRTPSFKKKFRNIPKSGLAIAVFIILLYWLTHLWNFSSAPWNQYGLFDDAAWDIYFAKDRIVSGDFYQAAFFDEVGYISRETVFHYYIVAFFKIFGYNLLVFNIALLFLGFVTVFFTTLIVDTLFRNTWVTLISAVIIDFFPLHFTHIFMGHRYAMASPLMVVSLYYLYTSLESKSFFRAGVSAFFAALCLGSSVMGKQYIMGLFAAAILIILFGRRKSKSTENTSVILVWVAGFVIGCVPLLVYIAFNYDSYIIREKGLLLEFINQFTASGFLGIKSYTDQLVEIFFADQTFRRQFLYDYVIIPLPYYVLLFSGLLISVVKSRFEIFLLAIIPVVGALLSGPYDFRVLLSVPIWVIGMMFLPHFVITYQKHRLQTVRPALVSIIIFVIMAGLLPSVDYLWKVSSDKDHIYLLPHKDVAVSRLVQHIVAGDTKPSHNLKKSEFKTNAVTSSVSYDTLVCPYSSYAIMHLYLQDFDDKKVLALCNQGIQLLKTPKEILDDNLTAIANYRNVGKDLKLIWEMSPKVDFIVAGFSDYRKYGNERIISEEIEGTKYSLYTLTIAKEKIQSFQGDVLKRFGE